MLYLLQDRPKQSERDLLRVLSGPREGHKLLIAHALGSVMTSKVLSLPLGAPAVQGFLT